MAYTETTTTSYGGRLTRSIKGIGTGFLMIIAGTILIFWNEGNYVKTHRALNEAQGITVNVDDVSTLDPALQGKFIHATTTALTDEILEDSEFGVSENAIALKRKVEYYQYEERSKTETRDKLGGGEERITTYTYHLGWQQYNIDSASFKDPDYQGRNFMVYPTGDETKRATKVSFGAYTLPDYMISSISGAEPVTISLTTNQIAAMQAVVGQTLNLGTNTSPLGLVHVSNNTIYLGRTPGAPQLGDIRVTITKVPTGQTVSILGQVRDNTFSQFVAKNGKKISRLETGSFSSDEMFEHAKSQNRLLTWILRLFGVILVCGGLRSVLGIFEALAKVIPLLGSIVGIGIGLVSGIIGFAWSLIWIAIAWIYYRPLIGVPLIIIALALIVWTARRARQQKELPAATSET